MSLEIEAEFQKTTSRKWPKTGNPMAMWPMTLRYPEWSNSWPHYAYSPISRKQLEMLFSNSRLLDSLVCCEAVRWAILATAWLLVIIVTYEYQYSVEWCCVVWQHGVAPCGQTRPREGCTLLADARCQCRLRQSSMCHTTTINRSSCITRLE